MKPRWLRFPAGERAVLLVHGFTGSTGEVAELARSLSDAGYTTLAPLLPGHGTTPADLADVTWRDWFEAVVESYEELRRECTSVAVGGLSMGGTLAFHLAAHRPEICAVFGLAVPIRLPTWQRKLASLLRYIVRTHHKARKADVRDEAALEELQSYDRYPLRAANELMRLCAHVYDDLPEVRQPALLIHSVQDNTVPVDNVHIIAERIRSASKQIVLLEKSFHVITVDVEKGRVTSEVLSFLDRVFQKRLRQESSLKVTSAKHSSSLSKD